MNWFDQIVSSQLVYRLGWAVIHSLWQAAVLAGMLALMLLVIPKRKNTLRYLCSCLALFTLVAAFVTSACMIRPPTNHHAQTNPWMAASVPMAEPVAPLPSALTTTESDHPQTALTPSTPTAKGSRQTPAQRSWQANMSRTISPWIGAVTGAWFAGVCALSVWNLGGLIAVRRLRLIGTWPVSSDLTATLEELAQRLSVRRAIRLLQSTVVKTPMTIGWLRPVILMPISLLSEMSPQQIETIIAHELAHIRRYDYLVNMLQTLAETLLFHHPAVWWISHTIRTEREYCCDNAVITLTSDQINYAKALTSLAEIRNHVPQLAVAASGGKLLARIRHILATDGESSLHQNRSAGWSCIALVIVILAFAVGLSSDTVLAVPHRYGVTTDNGEYQTLQKMIGSWTVNTEQSTAAGHIERIDIKPDATCIRHETTQGADPRTFYDKIQLKSSTLTVSGYWGKQSFTLQVNNHTMTWSSPKVTITFERRTEKSASKNALQQSIIGTWHTNEVPAEMGNVIKSMTIIFRPNGTATMKRIGTRDIELVVKNAQYEVAADTIELLEDGPGETPETLLWEIRGEFLYLGDKPDEMIKFERNATGEPESVTTENLIGVWHTREVPMDWGDATKSVIIVFRSDGTSTMKRLGIRDIELDVKNTYYKLTADCIELLEDESNENPETLLWEIRGEFLYLGDNPDEMIKFEKGPEEESYSITVDDLIGTWQMIGLIGDNKDKIDFMELTFNTDGSWQLLAESRNGSDFSDQDKGTYIIQNGKLSFEGHPEVDLSFNGKRLTVLIDETSAIFEKHPAIITNPEALIGKWKCEDAPGGKNKPFDFIILEFRIDRSGRSSRIGFDGQEVGSDSFEYKVERSILSTKGSDSDDDWQPTLWQIEGDVLYLTDIDDYEKTNTLERLDSADLPAR